MQKQRNGFFHLMCLEKLTDEVLYPVYSESRLAMCLEHASVDAILFNSFEKRSITFECKYVSKRCTPYVTFELSHQNGKVGWALDECTMNNDIVFFLQGVGAVVCDMKVFQSAVRREYDGFDIGMYNESEVAKVHYEWLINEAGGVYYAEEDLLRANKEFNYAKEAMWLSTVCEVGVQGYRYSMDGLVQLHNKRIREGLDKEKSA